MPEVSLQLFFFYSQKAAFHLRYLDLLQQVGLLDRVTMLSTVSGGTITGAKYVLVRTQAITIQKQAAQLSHE
ncbi:MAG: hypothetical protein ICV85_16285 [Tolypothrix sp. T3-bin4]|nr:hypothetical protein [Tolypothrix sp. T3-bin4]